jgi:hypothetical protein
MEILRLQLPPAVRMWLQCDRMRVRWPASSRSVRHSGAAKPNPESRDGQLEFQAK